MIEPPCEDTRVKLPALFHCKRLGYNYISLKDYLKEGKLIDQDTNIFLDIFKDSVSRINNTGIFRDSHTYYDKDSAKLLLEFLSQSLGAQTLVNKISDSLENEDLGRKFYNFLINGIDVESLLLTNSDVINNSAYFDGQLKSFILPELQKQKVTFTLPQVVNMTKLIENEYFVQGAI